MKKTFCDKSFERGKIFCYFSLSQQVKVYCLDSTVLHVQPYYDVITTDSIPIDGNTLIVCWRVTKTVKRKMQTGDPATRRYFFKSPSLTVEDLDFTGSEYKTVMLVLGQNVDAKSKSCFTLMYNTLTRATERVYVFCHSAIFSEIDSMLSFSEKDVVFDKQRSGHNLGRHLFQEGERGLLSEREDKLEAYKIANKLGNTAQVQLLGDQFKQEFSSAFPLLYACFQGSKGPNELSNAGKVSESRNNSGFAISDENKTADSEIVPCLEENLEAEVATGDSQVSTSFSQEDKKTQLAENTSAQKHPEAHSVQKLNLFHPENKEFLRIANFISQILMTQNCDDENLQQAKNSLRTKITASELELPSTSEMREISRSLPVSQETKDQVLGTLPLFRNMASSLDEEAANKRLSSNVTSQLVQIATKIASGNDCRDQWNNFVGTLFELNPERQPDQEQWRGFMNNLFGPVDVKKPEEA